MRKTASAAGALFVTQLQHHWLPSSFCMAVLYVKARFGVFHSGRPLPTCACCVSWSLRRRPATASNSCVSRYLAGDGQHMSMKHRGGVSACPHQPPRPSAANVQKLHRLHNCITCAQTAPSTASPKHQSTRARSPHSTTPQQAHRMDCSHTQPSKTTTIIV